MNEFDTKVPANLKEIQKWFGMTISRPLAEHGGIEAVCYSGKPIDQEAAQYIAPSPTLKAHERIQIYNQQYWWRLLNNLQETFPFLLRLFGYSGFNEDLGIPYLTAHPPNYWSLGLLGKLFPKWIQTSYKAKDATLVYEASLIDRAYYVLFYRPILPPLAIPPEQFDQFVEKKLYLQPHVYLFQQSYDLFTWRSEFLKHGTEHWMNNEFPELKQGRTFTLLFRTLRGNTAWRTIVEAEYLLLKEIQKGTSIDLLCGWLEKQPRKIRADAETSLKSWFEDWTRRGILTTSTYENTVF